MGFTPFRAGDIVVFKVADREIPIVHRIIKVNAATSPASAARVERVALAMGEIARTVASAPQVHEKESGEIDMLTKGDNNQVDDRGLYAGEPRAPA